MKKNQKLLSELFRMQQLAGIKQLSEERLPMLQEVSIDMLKNQYVDTGKLSMEAFEKILKASNKKSAYATWLAKNVSTKNIKEEDIYKFKNYFKIFDNHKNKFPKNDIFQYQELKDINNFVSIAAEIYLDIQQNPALDKGLEKTQKFQSLKIGNVAGFDVYKLPKGRTDLYLTSCELGSGTEWCTAVNDGDSETFESYINQGDLFIFIKGKEKYQFHYPTNQFMDKYDQSVF